MSEVEGERERGRERQLAREVYNKMAKEMEELSGEKKEEDLDEDEEDEWGWGGGWIERKR